LAEATSGEQALGVVREVKPQVALVDINLPAMNGIQVTRRILADKLDTAVVLLTAYDDVEQVLHAFRAGAAAYCSKDVEPGKLVDIIRQVARGFYVVGDQVYDKDGALILKERSRPIRRFPRERWKSFSMSPVALATRKSLSAWELATRP
jgi:DNA-binding NarL/FixJ family response regulator